jgi:hypothetical protein
MLAALSPGGGRYEEFQGGRIANVPELPGLYAWYYRPIAVNGRTTPETLARFFSHETQVKTTVRQRYGMHLSAEANGEIKIGSERQPVSDAIAAAFVGAEPFMNWFFRSPQFVQFSRPVYIGIAKNLYDRVYSQHYVTLTQYWDDTHGVSRFLASRAGASVQNVMDALSVPHSFALEARVKGISSADLMVAVLPTDQMPADIGPDDAPVESKSRRSLEYFLQLLSDPICGRR